MTDNEPGSKSKAWDQHCAKAGIKHPSTRLYRDDYDQAQRM